MNEKDYENEPAFIGGDAETVRKWQVARILELVSENNNLQAENATLKRSVGLTKLGNIISYLGNRAVVNTDANEWYFDGIHEVTKAIDRFRFTDSNNKTNKPTDSE